MSSLEARLEEKRAEKLAQLRPKLLITPDDYPTGTMSAPVWRSYTKEGYTPAQKTLVEYFFTNSHKNVYGAIPGRMPDELWAFLIGRYSRSASSLRDRFLDVFEEMQKEKDKKKADGQTINKDDYVTLDELAQQLQQSQAVKLQMLLKRAQRFLGQWGTGEFGHASLRDSDILRFAVEGISQLSTKYLEAASLGSYQEQSTRYINFKQRGLIIPPALKNSAHHSEIKTFFSLVMKRYEHALLQVQNFMEEKVINKEEFSNEEKYSSAVKGKTLDVVRYFLPLAAQTSLGMTIPTREAERHISWLLSQPLEELQLLGYNLLKEGLKLSPVLLEHVEVSQYESERRKNMAEMTRELNLTESPKVYGLSLLKPSVSLISPEEKLENLLLSAFIYEQSNLPFQEILERVKKCSEEEKGKISTNYFKERALHEEMGKAAGLNMLNFDCTLNLGAYRDLARHRRCLQLHQKFTPEQGYEFPEFLIDAKELEAVREEYICSVEEAYDLWRKVEPEIGEEAQYLSLMGHKINFLLSLDLREADYIMELRSRLGGHYSYRSFVQEMYWELEKQLPALTQQVRVHLEDPRTKLKCE